MQNKMLLALLLTSYNCLREASSESCISIAISFILSREAPLKNYIKVKANCGDAGLHHLRAVFGALQNAIATLLQQCLENIHLLDNKRTDLSKLLKIKLSFCLEHTFSVAKLFHQNEHTQDNEEYNKFLFQVYKYCTKCVRLIITDSEVQVQAVGLRVLKSLVQIELGDGSNDENHSFAMFFIGELVEDIFPLVHKMLKRPVTRETVVVTGDCLKLLVLLQTVSKVVECQKGLMNLLLEIILMVVSESTDESSQELGEIRSTALRLVSQLAQVPSSAIHFKDVLLAMPVARREKLQNIIRASVAVDTSTSNKPTASLLPIKIPLPNEQSKRDDTKDFAPASIQTQPDEDSFDDEEDWDNFQSFPATSGAGDANSNMGKMVDAGKPETAGSNFDLKVISDVDGSNLEGESMPNAAGVESAVKGTADAAGLYAEVEVMADAELPSALSEEEVRSDADGVSSKVAEIGATTVDETGTNSDVARTTDKTGSSSNVTGTAGAMSEVEGMSDAAGANLELAGAAGETATCSDVAGTTGEAGTSSDAAGMADAEIAGAISELEGMPDAADVNLEVARMADEPDSDIDAAGVTAEAATSSDIVSMAGADSELQQMAAKPNSVENSSTLVFNFDKQE